MKFNILPTDKTPLIYYNGSEIGFIGRSMPENAFKFYEKLFLWLDAFKKDSKDVFIKIDLEYFNTTSSKAIYMFLKELTDLNIKIHINWYHMDYDEDNKMIGEDFKAILNVNSFNIIAKT